MFECEKGEQQTVEGFFQDKQKIGRQSLVLAVLFIGIAMIAREWQIAVGIAIGLSLIFVNYLVMWLVIDRVVRSKERRSNPIFCLLVYLVRFWILVVFLYIMFRLWGTKLGLSIVAGMSIIKITALFDILEICFTDQIYPPNVLTNKKNR